MTMCDDYAKVPTIKDDDPDFEPTITVADVVNDLLDLDTASAPTPIEAWLCLDCMLSRETGETLEPLSPHGPTPLSLMENPADLTADFDSEESDEGIRVFDDTACAGCGSTLAGHRWRSADWSIQ
jgi:hypothetical protein